MIHGSTQSPDAVSRNSKALFYNPSWSILRNMNIFLISVPGDASFSFHLLKVVDVLIDVHNLPLLHPWTRDTRVKITDLL